MAEVLTWRRKRTAFLPLVCFFLFSASVSGKPKTELLQIGTGNNWDFYPSRWSDGSDHSLLPPAEKQGEEGAYQAFYKPSFRDFDVSFSYRVRRWVTDTGIIIRAASPDHYYLVHFPSNGQQGRAKHFWGAVSQVDQHGYIRYKKFAMIPHVSPEPDIWHDVRIVVSGTEVRVWVDGHAFPRVDIDDMPPSGRLGIYGWGAFDLKEVRVTGKSGESPDWPEQWTPSRNWFNPLPDQSLGKWQWRPHLTKTPKGDLLLAFAVHPNGYDPPHLLATARSEDKGKSWSKPRKLILPLDGLEVEQKQAVEQFSGVGHHYVPAVTTTRDGRLILQVFANPWTGEGESRVWGEAHVFMTESLDDGRSWEPLRLAPQWPQPDGVNLLNAWGNFLELSDGTLLRQVAGGEGSGKEHIYDWGSVHARAFSIRSTDGGSTWSPPVNLDGSRLAKLGNLDLTEAQCCETASGRVLCLIRPIYSPTMWETWSDDSGASWTPTTISSVVGYAADMLKTESGAILIGHRYPGLAVNVSRDDGLNWSEQVTIDLANWANGTMIEVEPNVVLYIYMTDRNEGRFRAQFIEVTPTGLRPRK